MVHYLPLFPALHRHDPNISVDTKWHRRHHVTRAARCLHGSGPHLHQPNFLLGLGKRGIICGWRIAKLYCLWQSCYFRTWIDWHEYKTCWKRIKLSSSRNIPKTFPFVMNRKIWMKNLISNNSIFIKWSDHKFINLIFSSFYLFLISLFL